MSDTKERRGDVGDVTAEVHQDGSDGIAMEASDNNIESTESNRRRIRDSQDTRNDMESFDNVSVATPYIQGPSGKEVTQSFFSRCSQNRWHLQKHLAKFL